MIELADELETTAPLHEQVEFELTSCIDEIINGELYYKIDKNQIHTWLKDLETILQLKGA